MYFSVPPASSMALTASRVARIEASIPLRSGVHQNSFTDPISSAVLMRSALSVRKAFTRTSAS
jgi:hypothetical protein